MTDRTTERGREDRAETGPVGTVLGATLGPLGAAVGTVVDESRLALAVSVGTGAASDEGSDDDLEDAATIEIADVGADRDEPEQDGESSED